MLEPKLPSKCPVCLGKHVARYRLYHDCEMRVRGKPSDVHRLPRRTGQSPCSYCGAPGAVTLAYCAGCRTMWVEQKPARYPAPIPHVIGPTPISVLANAKTRKLKKTAVRKRKR